MNLRGLLGSFLRLRSGRDSAKDTTWDLGHESGASGTPVMDPSLDWRHVQPVRRLIVQLRHAFANSRDTGSASSCTLAESDLAFLRLGVQPGTPSWGMDINKSTSLARLGY